MPVTEPTPDTLDDSRTDEVVAVADADAGPDTGVEAEVLVEEISIDGMCGVY